MTEMEIIDIYNETNEEYQNLIKDIQKINKTNINLLPLLRERLSILRLKLSNFLDSLTTGRITDSPLTYPVGREKYFGYRYDTFNKLRELGTASI